MIKYDQVAVRLVLEKQIDTIEKKTRICIIESDNCEGRYKSADDFGYVKQFGNELLLTITHVFCIACHGKGGSTMWMGGQNVLFTDMWILKERS